MIFDGTKQGISFLPKNEIGWPMGIYFRPVANGVRDFATIDRDAIEKGLSLVPFGEEICLDLEGDPTATDGRQLWDYTTHPGTAVSLRVEFLDAVTEVRPDLKKGLYSIPWRVTNDMVEREAAYKPITARSDRLYITAYPKPGESFAEWERTLRTKVGAAYWMHNKTPRVLITHETPRAVIGYREFVSRLRVLRKMGLDGVYWVSSRSEIPWWVKLALWSSAL